MINTIKYYYNLNVENIKQVNDDYYFDNHVLKLCYKEIDLFIYNYLLINNYYVHKIIYNRNREYVTNINNKPYILIEVNKIDHISFDLLNNYNIPLNIKKSPNWATLWETKIDYIEKNIVNVKDELIKKSFNYYVGMVENAIILYKSLNLSSSYYLCHIRLDNDVEFYDPLNLKIDFKMRDIAEFIKKEFFIFNKYHYNNIKKIIINNSFNDVMLFFIRMLYPSFYFDAYDNYMKNDSIDYSFYTKRDEYEKYLKSIYKEIRKKYNTISIDWLK